MNLAKVSESYASFEKRGSIHLKDVVGNPQLLNLTENHSRKHLSNKIVASNSSDEIDTHLPHCLN